jgi:predicted RNA-binding Zn-ribbon protein involved in translation (DUF1610 family)
MFCEYDIIGMVDNAPTVEITEEQAIDKLHDTGWLPLHDKEMTERPTGHWVNGYKSFNCSVCGKIAYSWNHFGEYIQVKSNFCPNCGADMRCKEEEE